MRNASPLWTSVPVYWRARARASGSQSRGEPGAEAHMADDPSLFDQFEQWYANSRDTEALDGKTKALIGLAVVLTGNCQP